MNGDQDVFKRQICDDILILFSLTCPYELTYNFNCCKRLVPHKTLRRGASLKPAISQPCVWRQRDTAGTPACEDSPTDLNPKARFYF